MNSFFKAQFNYFPLIWMNHSSENNRKINQHRERCFRIIYNNKKLPFNELLEKAGFVSIHVRNLQILSYSEVLAIERRISNKKAPNNLRHNSKLSRRLLKAVYNKTECISNLEPKIWGLVPNSLKEIVQNFLSRRYRKFLAECVKSMFKMSFFYKT